MITLCLEIQDQGIYLCFALPQLCSSLKNENDVHGFSDFVHSFFPLLFRFFMNIGLSLSDTHTADACIIEMVWYSQS